MIHQYPIVYHNQILLLIFSSMQYWQIAKLMTLVHFVHSNVLDGLWINTSIEKIGNVGVPQLMRGYIKVQRISDFGLILLGHAQRWGNRVFDALPIHILIIVPGLSGADNDILPHSLKLRSS